MDEEGWMKHACAKFRVFLLDQRGTGMSDAITTSTLLRQGDANAQAEYLSHFRCHSWHIRQCKETCSMNRAMAVATATGQCISGCLAFSIQVGIS